MTPRDLAGPHRPAPSRPAQPGRPGRPPASPRISQGTGPLSQAYLPANLTAPRQARAIVRRALAGWGLSALTDEAELLTSELVANAAEHATGPIRLTIRPHAEHGQRGILCRVSDASPSAPSPRQTAPDSERGRGLQIVAALATTSGVTTSPHGKTAWFTLTAAPDRTPPTATPDPKPNPAADLRSGTHQLVRRCDMTTVDVYIEKTGNREMFVLRNGLFGPAPQSRCDR
jgi:anti-sigma regulatory factor (Ser/Thr protein kinase)